MIINNHDYNLRFTMLKAKIENLITNKEISALDEIYWSARVYIKTLYRKERCSI